MQKFSKVQEASGFPQTVHIANSYFIAHTAIGTMPAVFQSTLACSLPESFSRSTAEFFYLQLLARVAALDSDWLNLAWATYNLKSALPETDFDTVCTVARNIGLMSLVDSIVVDSVCQFIQHCVHHNVSEIFDDSSQLQIFFDWTKIRLVSWARLVLGPKSEPLMAQIEYQLYKAFCDTRINKLFDIIVDFPSSEPALVQLKICVFETDRYNYLKSSLNKIISRRLLHLGANTSDIVSIYVSSIKCLNYLDSTGDLLHFISTLIRRYLRTREDSMKSVINLLTGDAKDAEDISLDAVPIVGEFSAVVLHKESKTKILQQQLPTDIATTLIQIFDSQEDFIKEFERLLAERLISNPDYEIDREIKNLELLKKHFSEAKLHRCEVMIKDIMDSKRVNTNICNSLTFSQPAVAMKILSRLFWPCNNDGQNQPECVKRFMNEYNTLYSKLKSMRSLRHSMDYGSVELELEFDNREPVAFTVTPAQASIIGFFEEKPEWTLPELLQVSGKPAEPLDRILSFWMQNGVLKKDSDGIFSIIESIEDQQEGVMEELNEVQMMEEKEEDSIESLRDAMKPYFPFIQGMLTNFGQTPVERIQQMLTQFVQSPKYSEKIETLRAYLDLLVEEDVCESSGNGVFSLRK
ncbi:hypothetical protein BDR26DRAFT_852611 [Obelidium mucronatum]|nr:hypothetical protein BDR26DRAFT_852611 [Obelidium mucronatum]